MLVQFVECLDDEVEPELVCEQAFDYGRAPGQWTHLDDDGHTGDVTGGGMTLRLATDLSIGIEGGIAGARHGLREGQRAFCAPSWADGPGRRRHRRRVQADPRDRHVLAGRAQEAYISDHPLRPALQRSALAIKGTKCMPTGSRNRRSPRRPQRVTKGLQ